MRGKPYNMLPPSALCKGWNKFGPQNSLSSQLSKELTQNKRYFSLLLDLFERISFLFRVLPLLLSSTMNTAKLNRLAEQVRTGGKGSVRRKKKAVHKTTTTDDKRLQSTLKRLGVNNIPGIEEVNLFKEDGGVIHFNNPKGILTRFIDICSKTFLIPFI